MRIVFMGTPGFAVATLTALIAAHHDIVCVYSQPPRPAGRGYQLRKSPVHSLAESQNIEVRTPVSLKSLEEQQKFIDLKADAAVVVAYGLLLPGPVLEATRHGCLNVHASLLPRWRGAAPLQRAIMAGDSETGVTIMRMEEGLDTGPMIRKIRVPITHQMTASSLHDKLMQLGAKAMVDVLQTPDVPGAVQPIEGITYAKKIDKAETKIDFTCKATDVCNHIHGLSSVPGAWFTVNGARVKVLKARPDKAQGDPGVFLSDALTIACSDAAIQLIELQREGKGVMNAEEFLRGFPVAAGTRIA